MLRFLCCLCLLLLKCVGFWHSTQCLFFEQEVAEGTERKLRHAAISLLPLLAPVKMRWLLALDSMLVF
jgi:hypothetical protein